MKLYFNPQSRAVIAKWMLDECGAVYELVHIDLEKREHKSPEYKAINPAGKLPALVDGDVRLFENAAICLYLADKFPEKRLAPAIGTSGVVAPVSESSPRKASYKSSSTISCGAAALLGSTRETPSFLYWSLYLSRSRAVASRSHSAKVTTSGEVCLE